MNSGFKALVTGGAGFIGSNLVKYLIERDVQVRVLDNLSTGYRENLPPSPRLQFMEGSILDAAALGAAVAGCDVVFHLAARVGNVRSIEDPVADMETNVGGTLQVLRAAVRAGVKSFIYSSSAAIFGEPVSVPLDENHPTHPESPYGVSKLTGEKYALCWGRLGYIRVVCLRYFNVYGVNQRFDAYGNVIPIFAKRLAEEQPLMVYGDGEQTRDFVRVEDVAQANYLAAVCQNAAGCFNIGSGHATTVKALIGLMGEVWGVSPQFSHAPERPGEVRHSCADIHRAASVLGYAPTPLGVEALRTYVDWFRKGD